MFGRFIGIGHRDLRVWRHRSYIGVVRDALGGPHLTTQLLDDRSAVDERYLIRWLASLVFGSPVLAHVLSTIWEPLAWWPFRVLDCWICGCAGSSGVTFAVFDDELSYYVRWLLGSVTFYLPAALVTALLAYIIGTVRPRQPSWLAMALIAGSAFLAWQIAIVGLTGRLMLGDIGGNTYLLSAALRAAIVTLPPFIAAVLICSHVALRAR